VAELGSAVLSGGGAAALAGCAVRRRRPRPAPAAGGALRNEATGAAAGAPAAAGALQPADARPAPAGGGAPGRGAGQVGGGGTTAPAGRGRAGVLIVDDYAPIRDLVRLVLEGAGYAVREAADGAAALRRVRAAPPDAILLDLEMPGLDGPGFLAAYRAGPGPHAPVVVMTATTEAARRATALGAAGWLGKPFDLAELRAVVARVAGPPGP